MQAMSISENELHHIFSEEVEYILFLRNDWIMKMNLQSCDCDSVLIKMKNRDSLICLTCEDRTIIIKEIFSFDPAVYSLKHTPPENVKVVYTDAEMEYDTVTGLKFKYGDRYLFIFAADKWLIVTISICDLMDDDDMIPDHDDSDLSLEIL